MLNFKKILFLTFATAFISQVNATSYKITNDSNKSYAVLCFYKSGETEGITIKAKNDKILNPEENCEIVTFYIFESLKNVHFVSPRTADNKFIRNTGFLTGYLYHYELDKAFDFEKLVIDNDDLNSITIEKIG
jgi:hypothetical protein